MAWHRLIWSQFHIPKYSLIAWMAILDRLLTISRLSSWGIAIANDRCVLRDPELKPEIIYLTRLYSKPIWLGFLDKCGIQRRVDDWSVEFQWAIDRLKGRALLAVILRIAWSAYMYFIWKERNNKIYGRQANTSTAFFSFIAEAVRYRLCGIKEYSWGAW